MLHLLVITLIFLTLYKRLRSPYKMEYKTEFVSVPSSSKKLVWSLRYKPSIFSYWETIQISSNQEDIKEALTKSLRTYYGITEDAANHSSFWIQLKRRIAFFNTGIVL